MLWRGFFCANRRPKTAATETWGGNEAGSGKGHTERTELTEKGGLRNKYLCVL